MVVAYLKYLAAFVYAFRTSTIFVDKYKQCSIGESNPVLHFVKNRRLLHICVADAEFQTPLSA
jgi:hypothetical protein